MPSQNEPVGLLGHTTALEFSRFVRVVALSFCVLIAGSTQLSAQHSPLVDAVDRSGFIFVGTVKALGSSTPTVARTRNSAVVRVDRVIEALPPIGDPTGKDVTVRLRSSQKVQKGQRAIFFTYLQTAGKTLGLVEVMLQPETQANKAEIQVKDARQLLADEALTRRLTSASMVVVGVFGEPQPTEEARERKGEHDPMWWRGPIKVESFEKGERTEKPVFVNFASSDDVVWERSPKPKAGERAIFLLQPRVGRAIEKEYEIPGLFLVDPLDMRPVTELDRIRKLIKASAH